MVGFMMKNESPHTAADRILNQLTGLEDIFMEQLRCFGAVDRDPVERTLSVAFYALINVQEHDQNRLKKFNAEWFKVSELPNLIFDHLDMVNEAKARLKHMASYHPVGFELLPEKFTIRQIQTLYEAIFEQPIDKRNFSRRIFSLEVLDKLEEKEKGHSKKGAFYYRFKPQKYQELLSNGGGFLLKP